MQGQDRRVRVGRRGGDAREEYSRVGTGESGGIW